MGGLNSGRRRSHVCIDDCLEIDLMHLNRQKRLQQSGMFTLVWGKWRETNFSKRTVQEHKAYALLNLDKHTLTLMYQACRQDNGHEQIHKHKLTMEATPCNYGSQRWWFRAPCCQRRVRVLYINLKVNNIANMRPLCRDCQELHYASQCSSYVERHATYERYLLSNYGYTWASIEYHCLRHHYFTIDEEYRYKMAHSELTRQLELMKHLIRAERMIVKSRVVTLKKLSLEGRKELFEHLANDPDRAKDLAEYQHLANILIAKGMIPADNQDQDDQVAPLPNDVQQEQDNDLPEEMLSLQLAKWIIQQEAAEEELKELDQIAA